MDDRIYQAWVIRNDPFGNQSWAALSETKREEIYGEVSASGERVGGKTELICNCTWANQDYFWWGIESYPDLAALQARTEMMEKAGKFNYNSCFSMLATAENGPNPVTFPNPIYGLFFVENNSAALANFRGLSKEAEQEFWARDAVIMKETGCVYVLLARVWSDARYSRFGVMAAPNLAALQGYMIESADANHFYQYLTCGLSLLGTEYKPG